MCSVGDTLPDEASGLWPQHSQGFFQWTSHQRSIVTPRTTGIANLGAGVVGAIFIQKLIIAVGTEEAHAYAASCSVGVPVHAGTTGAQQENG